MAKEKIYVMHVCKNSKNPEFIYKKDSKGKIISKKKNPDYCNNGWIDEDKTHVKDYPPNWKYCSECVTKGFKNPRTRNYTMTPEQIEAFKIRMAKARADKKTKANKKIAKH